VEKTELDTLAVSLLDRVRQPSGQHAPPQPPETDLLEGLAKNLGADQVLWGGRGYGSEDGMVEVVGDRIMIRIRRCKARRRERFTLAHEIGHLVLAQPDLRLMSMRRRTGLEDTERFCDAFAAALLMPREWIEHEYGERPESLETLLDCSAGTETSLSATLLRLKRSLDWSTSLLHWRRTDSRWCMVGLTGIPYRLYRELSSTDETQRALDELSVGRRTTKIPLEVPSGPIRVDAEVSAHPSSVVALVDLREIARAQWRRASGRSARPRRASV
jgi:IrrE N-terminal-like domain